MRRFGNRRWRGTLAMMAFLSLLSLGYNNCSSGFNSPDSLESASSTPISPGTPANSTPEPPTTTLPGNPTPNPPEDPLVSNPPLLPEPAEDGIFVDSVAGNDSNSGISPLNPKKTLTSAVTAAQAGRNILYLKCGSSFGGNLNLQASSITRISSYGNCQSDLSNAPIISPALPVNSLWATYSSQIYVTNVGAGRSIRSVVMKRNNQTTYFKFAQWPKRGPTSEFPYVFLSGAALAADGATSFDTQGKLTRFSGDYIGALISLRPNAYFTDDCYEYGDEKDCHRVANFRSGTITLARGAKYGSDPSGRCGGLTAHGLGFFLLNKLWMLTENGAPGEFVYDSVTGQLYVFLALSQGIPQPGEISLVEKGQFGIDLSRRNGVTLERLQILNAHESVIADSATNLTVDRMKMVNATLRFINAKGSRNVSVTNSVFSKSRHSGIDYGDNFTFDSSTMNEVASDQDQPTGTKGSLFSFGTGNVIKNSNFDGTGYAFTWNTNPVTVINNKAKNGCSTLRDCGAFYVNTKYASCPSGQISPACSSIITGNKISNTIWRDENIGVESGSSAIYLDDGTSFSTVNNNLIDGTQVGIFLNGGQQNTLEGNTIRNYSFLGVQGSAFMNSLRSNIFSTDGIANKGLASIKISGTDLSLIRLSGNTYSQGSRFFTAAGSCDPVVTTNSSNIRQYDPNAKW